MSEEMNAEQEARGLGWVPAEEFKGDPSRWVDAETFIERGHTVMPILRKNNEKLETTVKQQQAEINRLNQLFQASQESIQELQKVHSDATRAAVEKARRDLLSELRQAKESGNIEVEMQLTEELADLKAKQKEIEARQPIQAMQAPVQNSAAVGKETLHPDFAEWQSNNPWFGTDQRKTMRAMGIAQQLRSDEQYDALQGKAFYDKVLEVMNEGTSQRPTKVGESRPSGSGGGGGGGKSFSSLPSDAREACDRQGRKLVGEGRAFKDMNAWRQYYTQLYYQGEA